MENFKIIEFHKTRDFSNKLNTTFAFVKQNFKALSKSILYIAGPPVLVASLLLSTFMADFFKLVLGAAGNPEAFQNYFLSVNFWLQMVLMFVFMMVSYVAIIATTNNYLILYNEQKSNAIDVNDVWVRVRETLGICDRAYIVNEGRIFAEGAPADIVANELVKEVYLGRDFRL